MSSQSTIHITFELPPKALPKFYKALKTLQEHVIAEPECVYFNCFELPKQPGKVRIVEIWNQDKKWRKEVSFTPKLNFGAEISLWMMRFLFCE